MNQSYLVTNKYTKMFAFFFIYSFEVYYYIKQEIISETLKKTKRDNTRETTLEETKETMIFSKHTLGIQLNLNSLRGLFSVCLFLNYLQGYVSFLSMHIVIILFMGQIEINVIVKTFRICWYKYNVRHLIYE